MKTTKHTPGPWIQVQEIDDSDNSILIRTKKQAIASVLPKPHFCDEQHANARLIAAAPDLLAALKAIEPLLAIAYNPNPDDDDLFTVGRGRVQQLCNLASAALASAEGDKP